MTDDRMLEYLSAICATQDTHTQAFSALHEQLSELENYFIERIRQFPECAFEHRALETGLGTHCGPPPSTDNSP
jgi:hypothetical protein